MAGSVTVGLRVPSTPAAQDIDALARWAHEAEALGFDALWVGDHVFHPVAVYHPLQLLTWLAALTRRVRLGTAVMLFAYRNPVLVAKQIATLDRLSQGRAGPIAVSLGGTEAEFQAMGVSVKQRVSRLTEGFRLTRDLLTEGTVDHEGHHHRVHGAAINPRPVQLPRPPLWLGGSHENALRRAAQLADGWIATSQLDATDLDRMGKQIIAFTREAGRNPDSFGFGNLQSVSIAADRAAARALSESHLGPYYGGRFNMDRYLVHGTAQEVRTGLEAFTRADLPNLALSLEPPTLDLDQLKALADAALPLRK